MFRSWSSYALVIVCLLIHWVLPVFRRLALAELFLPEPFGPTWPLQLSVARICSGRWLSVRGHQGPAACIPFQGGFCGEEHTSSGGFWWVLDAGASHSSLWHLRDALPV